MEVDLKETLRLVKGGLLDHRATWQGYLDQDPPWQKTAGLLAGPILLVNVVLTLLLARIFGGYMGYGYSSNLLVAIILGLISAVLGMIVAALVLGFVAGFFGGQNNFSRALAAISLAFIPAAVASVVGALVPFLGLLITLAGSIVSLVFLYQILPMALAVPEPKRTLHFVLSLVGMFILNLVFASVFGLSGMGQSTAPYSVSSGSDDSTAVTTSGSGFLGEMQRQGELLERAAADRYRAPADGMISKEQIRAYVKVKQKTKAAHARYAEKMKNLGDEIENKDKPSFSDISKVYSGLGGAMGANNAEMEIVTTGGGNWAEHLWVAQALRTAVIQQGDGSEALEHNFALYQKYREDLE